MTNHDPEPGADIDPVTQDRARDDIGRLFVEVLQAEHGLAWRDAAHALAAYAIDAFHINCNPAVELPLVIENAARIMRENANEDADRERGGMLQ